MRPYVEADYYLPYLIVDSEVQHFPPELQRERGGVGKVSPTVWLHLYLFASFHNMFYVNKKGECE
jgi:hypothetical protein